MIFRRCKFRKLLTFGTFCGRLFLIGRATGFIHGAFLNGFLFCRSKDSAWCVAGSGPFRPFEVEKDKILKMKDGKRVVRVVGSHKKGCRRVGTVHARFSLWRRHHETLTAVGTEAGSCEKAGPDVNCFLSASAFKEVFKASRFFFLPVWPKACSASWMCLQSQAAS